VSENEILTELPVITGELRDWHKVTYNGKTIISGVILGDIRQRFRDGTTVWTSNVTLIDGDLAYTLNSVYRLIGPEKVSE
jgi:hypothetical protein